MRTLRPRVRESAGLVRLIDVDFDGTIGRGVSRVIDRMTEASKLFTSVLSTPGNMLPVFSDNPIKSGQCTTSRMPTTMTYETTLKCAENHGKSVFHA